MKFPVQKYVSNFIPSQFPTFYEVDGPDFILFLQAYYEWMESQNDITTGYPNAIGAARNLFDYRDIDNTLDQFLQHFQQKYLYGIPFNVIINKRFLLKHVLDVYRSKGTIQCYKLLFKLIYNQDVDIYLPKLDILKPSDGSWIQPVYIEISDNGNLSSYIGKSITGLSSKITAVVEDFTKEKINDGIVCTFYLSNISPPSLEFIQGETIVLTGTTDASLIANSPKILGSISSMILDFSDVNFSVGDILKIADHDLITNNVATYGVNSLLKITELTSTAGIINFNIANNGFGYLANSDIFVYNSSDNEVNPASFGIGTIGYTNNISYNTDILADYFSVTLNANSYGFPANLTANLSSSIVSSLNFQTQSFGSIVSLDNIVVGNNYLSSPYVFVLSTMNSKTIPGTVSFSSTNNIVNGVNTQFSTYFTTNSVIVLIANSSVYEKQVVQSVVNNTQLILYSNTIYTSTNGTYKVATSILPSNYTNNDNISNYLNIGNNFSITATASYGNNNVQKVSVLDSGKGYIDNEFVNAYLYNTLNPVIIANGGIGYSNSDTINFIGGSTTAYVTGKITTNSTGGIISVTNNPGSNFDTPPNIIVSSNTGLGANLYATISTYNSSFGIRGNIVKSGVGYGQGYWSTTRSFLNSDKYIQDDYFYQDFSYQIKAASTLQSYKDILYNTFHPAGSAMFGEYYSIDSLATQTAIFYEQSSVTLI